MGLLGCSSTKVGWLCCPLVWGVYILQALAKFHWDDDWSTPCWERVVLSAACRVQAESWDRNAQGCRILRKAAEQKLLLEPCQPLQQHHCTKCRATAWFRLSLCIVLQLAGMLDAMRNKRTRHPTPSSTTQSCHGHLPLPTLCSKLA